MTYGFRPENWWTFQEELRARGIELGDIEKVEMRLVAAETGPDLSATTIVTVTLRSGRIDRWSQRHAEVSPRTWPRQD